MPVAEYIECWKCGHSYEAREYGNCPKCDEHWLDDPELEQRLIDVPEGEDTHEVYDPENEKIWCDRCQKHTMTEQGVAYVCPICENWRYSSS